MSLKITIVIPTFNRSKLIIKTLNSVHNQSYDNWECIIVDDGSTDNTVDVIKDYIKDDSRFLLSNRPNTKLKGANSCRNYGAELSTGCYLIFLDSDDLLESNALQIRIEEAKKNKYDMVVSHSCSFRSKIGDSRLLWNKIAHNESNYELIERFLNIDMPWCTNAVLWRKDFFKKIDGWDETLSAWQDWDIHFRALIKMPTLKIMHTIDNYFRIGDYPKIGASFKKDEYFNSIDIVIIKTKKLLKPFKNLYFGNAHKNFILRMAVIIPLKKGRNFRSLRHLSSLKLKNDFFIVNYLKVYLLFLLSKKKFLYKILKNDMLNEQIKFEDKSTYMKIQK